MHAGGLLHVVKDIAIGAKGHGFDFQAGKIGRSVTNGLPPVRRFFGAVLPGARPLR